MKTKEIDKKIRGPKVRDIVYLHILGGGSDLYICFRLLLVTFILPCNKCAWHWFKNMLMLLFAIVFKLESKFPQCTYDKYGVRRLYIIAYAQRNILLEQGMDVHRTGEQIAMYIKEERQIDDYYLTPLL